MAASVGESRAIENTGEAGVVRDESKEAKGTKIQFVLPYPSSRIPLPIPFIL
jgi:hypothetical protein